MPETKYRLRISRQNNTSTREAKRPRRAWRQPIGAALAVAVPAVAVPAFAALAFLGALVAGTSVAGALGADAGARGAPARADETTVPGPPVPAGSVPNTAAAHEAAAHEAAAHEAAAALLAALPLPPGATPSATEPSGDDGLLAGPGAGPPATPNAVDEHAWWTVPGVFDPVLAYIHAHLEDSAKRLYWGGSTGPGEPPNDMESFHWPPIAGVLISRGIVVHVVQLPDGVTGLRADSQVVWITPRPPGEVIPAGARLLRVSVYGTLEGKQPKQPPLTFSSPSKIERLTAALNALPAAQPGLMSCPTGSDIEVRLAFFADRDVRTPLAVVKYEPVSCGVVWLTIRGKAEPALEAQPFEYVQHGDIEYLIAQVDRTLGVKLHTEPPRPTAGREPQREPNTVTT